ncbi:MAG: acyltransferase [Moorea sp. SIOASIH]|uniref:acyltransferase family protein n=1 Tax=Moorena sp. SIOASIH TaxID=2607817 RepID=UPI0013BBD0F1|nr:acyltransferase [Moorena sp. SIOASIH]NEO36148.1 acyltransferase [Moorena sp. SIOASIH]
MDNKFNSPKEPKSNQNNKHNHHKQGFLESIHLMRGLAAALVLIDHTFGWIDLGILSAVIAPIDGHGQVGVTIFFVISGFILPYSMLSKYKLKHYTTFIAKRLIRLDPVYYVAILFSILLLYVKTRLSANGVPWELDWGQLFAHFLYFIPFTNYKWLNEAFWTLGIEFQFYLLLGLIFPLIKYAIREHSRLFCILSILLAILALNLSALAAGIGFKIVPYLALFILGILSFGYYIKWLKTSDFWVTSFLVVIIYSLSPAGDVSKSLVAAISVLAIIFWQAPVIKLRFLGTISYSLYVIHYPITAFINGNVGKTLVEKGGIWSSIPWIFPMASLSISLLAAWMMYLLIEVPTMKLAKKIRYQS